MIKNNKLKNIALAIVALILVLMMTVGITYSWIDDIKLVEFQNDDLVSNNAPLKTGTDINSDITITKSNNTINLGNMLSKSDYMYTENETQHIRYDGSNNSRKPDWDEVNEKKGYFYESGGMHLSGCYSDGETFYFSTSQSNTYREGNKDDENVNYISFTAKVSSPDANVDFWFEELPTIHQHGTSNSFTNNSADVARYAITVDGKSHVYSPTGTAKTITGGSTKTSVSGVRSTAAYTYGNSANTNDDIGKNGNTLFSIKKGKTVLLNIKIWLEGDFDTELNSSDISLSIGSSYGKYKNIKIYDRTTTNTKLSWLKDASAKLFLTCPAVLKDLCAKKYNNPTVSDWKLIKSQSGYEDAPFYELTSPTTEDGCDVYTVPSVPMIYNEEELILYRCSSSGWNNGSHRLTAAKIESLGFTDYGVTYHNWWRTSVPKTYTSAKYTLYGGSHDNYASAIVADDNRKETFLGYGTWGSVEKITVSQKYHGVDWASGGTNNNIYIKDFTDYSSTGEYYVHSMKWDGTLDDNKGAWIAYIPKSSNLLQFIYSQSSVAKAYFGYDTFGHLNPQMRPSGSTHYHLTFKNDKDNGHDGLGYWSGANKVYFIANNADYSDKTNMWAEMYYAYKKNGSDNYFKNVYDETGTSMTMLDDKYQGTYNVFASDDLDSSNGNNMYPDRSKSDQTDTTKQITEDLTVIFNCNITPRTAALTLFPGCYYDSANNNWLGSLTGTARVATEDTSGGEIEEGETSMDTTTLTTSISSSQGVYAYGTLDSSGSSKYAKFSSNNEGGYITLHLTQGSTYSLELKNNGTTQATTQNNSVTLSDSINRYWYMNKGQTNALTFDVSKTGYYRIKIVEVQTNSIQIKLYYVS